MRYFLDTEFLETGSTIVLISIGIVAEDGRQLYCENSQFDWDRASDWLNANVKPHLWTLGAWQRNGSVTNGGSLSLPGIARKVYDFCDPSTHGKPEFWGYYADYDWVVFCWLFGRMIDLPKGFPKYCRDLKQRADDLDLRLPEQQSTEHHALYDARWNKEIYDFLKANDPRFTK